MHPGVNYAEGDAILGGHSRSSARRRNPMACLICRRRKIKCEFNNGQEVCDHCLSKNTKCTVLSVAQEEALKALGYTDESLTLIPNAELESFLRRPPLQLHSSAEQAETHLTPRPHQHYHGPPSSPHHPLPSTGQDRSENLYRTQAHDPGNRAAPSPYNNSAHNHHTQAHDPGNRAALSPYNNSAHNHHTQVASRTTVPINVPHPQAHPHHQSSSYPNYPPYTSPSPNHQMSYQIPATGGASVPHHTMPVGDHHQLQSQLQPNIPAHSNAVQSQDHANYSAQANYPFQANQQPSQGQIAQYQCGGYPATMAPGYTTHDGSWTRR